MTNRSEETDRPRDAAFSAAFALMVTAMACAIFLCAVPRPAPFELPVLLLDAEQVRAQIEADRRFVAALSENELTRALYGALREIGRNELEHDEARAYALEQRIRGLKKRADKELGAEGQRAVRAYAAQQSMLAFSAQLDDEKEERELIGAQRAMFAAYGYITPEGIRLAPELTLRVMFKVRWNMIFGDPSTHALTPIELCAYEGFRALEAKNVPPDLRLNAMYQLIRAGGGPRAERALTILYATNGKGAPLIARVQGSEREGALIRMRNMAIAALPRPEL